MSMNGDQSDYLLCMLTSGISLCNKVNLDFNVFDIIILAMLISFSKKINSDLISLKSHCLG